MPSKDEALRNPYMESTSERGGRVARPALRPQASASQLQPQRRASIPTSARSCGLYSSSSAMVEGTVGCLSFLLSCAERRQRRAGSGSGSGSGSA